MNHRERPDLLSTAHRSQCRTVISVKRVPFESITRYIDRTDRAALATGPRTAPPDHSCCAVCSVQDPVRNQTQRWRGVRVGAVRDGWRWRGGRIAVAVAVGCRIGAETVGAGAAVALARGDREAVLALPLARRSPALTPQVGSGRRPCSARARLQASRPPAGTSLPESIPLVKTLLVGLVNRTGRYNTK